MSFGAALDSKISSWLVKTTDGDSDRGQQYMTRLSSFKDHDFMQNMPWEEAGRAAIAAAQKLVDMKSEIKHWKVPLNVAELKSRFDAISADFDKELAGLEDYLLSTDRLEAQIKNKSKLDKDLFDDVKNKFYSQLLRDGVSKGVGKIWATTIAEFDASKGPSCVNVKELKAEDKERYQEWGSVSLCAPQCTGSTSAEEVRQLVDNIWLKNKQRLESSGDKVEVEMCGAGKKEVAAKKSTLFCAFNFVEPVQFPAWMAAADATKGFLWVQEKGPVMFLMCVCLRY